MTQHNQCLVFQTPEDAQSIAVMARKRDGAEVEVVDNIMYFPDKFTFDHINYHYRMKSIGDKNPLIQDVPETNSTSKFKP
jgi:hypothetical protein